jgi:DNA-binding NarL/FixJ family response regulator
MVKIRILVVDDHAVVREGLRALLTAEEDMDVIGEAQDGREGVDLAFKTSPDVGIMDRSMPVLGGLEATGRILKSLPSTRVLVLTSYLDEECLDKLIESGAAGYLTKQSAAVDLCGAIRDVRHGKSFWGQDVARIIRDKDRVEKLPGSNKPTERETQVLQFIAEGLTNKRIAAELGISVKTVEKHRQALMNKLNIHEAAGLTRYAVSKGLVGKKP